MNGEYLILLAAILAFPLALSGDRNIAIYRHAGALLKSMAAVSALFWIWDVAATARGHWSFNPAHVLGIRLLGVPLEEWLFFLVVAFVSVFTWESTQYFLRRKK